MPNYAVSQGIISETLERKKKVTEILRKFEEIKNFVFCKKFVEISKKKNENFDSKY